MPEGLPFPLPPFFPGGGDEGDRHFRTPDGRDLGTNPSLEDVLNEYRRITAPNPQEGVTELPPPSSNDPAPLPNPTGEYATPAPAGDNMVAEPVGAGYIPTGNYGAEPGPFGDEVDEYSPPVPSIPGTGAWEGDDWVFRDRSGRELRRNRGRRKKVDEVAPDWLFRESRSFGSGVNPFRSNIVAGEEAGRRIATPFPNEPIFNPPGEEFRVERRIPTRIERSDEYYRREVERMQRDTEKRLSRRVIEGVAEAVGPRAIGRVLGPIGVIVGEVLTPGELGGGQMIPGLELPLPAPPDIPAPVITQPEPLPLPAPTPTPLPAPSPPAQPSTSGAPSAAGPASTGTPAPQPGNARTRVPRTTSVARQLPWWTLLSRTITSRRTNPWPTAPGLTSSPSPSASSPPPSPAPAPSATPNPLTGAQPSVSQSAPPTTPTRTRTRECQCDPKPKKRKKPRECIGRGQLIWGSGPKKGKAAGSRCYSFVGGSRK